MSINFKALERVKQDKINEYLLYSCGTSAINPRLYGEIFHEGNDDFNFIYFESIADNFTNGMKRYHFLVYSSLYFDCYYRTSNVIDINKGYSIGEMKVWFNNYLKSLHSTLQQYL